MEHQIEGRRSPPAQVIRLRSISKRLESDLEPRKVFGEGLDVFPVNGCSGDRRAGRPGASSRVPEQRPPDGSSAAREPAKPRRQVPVSLLVGGETRADEQGVAVARVRHRRIGRYREARLLAVTGPPSPGHDLPVIETSPRSGDWRCRAGRRRT